MLAMYKAYIIVLTSLYSYRKTTIQHTTRKFTVNLALVWGNWSESPVTVMNLAISKLSVELREGRIAGSSTLLVTEWHDKNM